MRSSISGSSMCGRLIHIKVLYCEKFTLGSKSVTTLAAAASSATESRKKRPTAILRIRVFIFSSQAEVGQSPSYFLAVTKDEAPALPQVCSKDIATHRCDEERVRPAGGEDWRKRSGAERRYTDRRPTAASLVVLLSPTE